MDGALQGDGQRLQVVAVRRWLGVQRHGHLFVAECEALLQGLAQPGDLPGAFAEHQRLVEEEALQLFADVGDFRAQQFQQFQTQAGAGVQLVDLENGLVEKAGGFAEIRFG